MRLIVLSVFVLLISACSSAGSASTSAVAPFGLTPVPVPAGQSMTDASRHSVTMLDYHRDASTHPGKQCVRVSVTVTNSDAATWFSPMNQLQLADTRGFVYYRSDDCGTNTTLQALGPGESAAAILYFEVMTNATIDFNWAPKIGDPGFSTPLR
jgi:hypothetical protein